MTNCKSWILFVLVSLFLCVASSDLSAQRLCPPKVTGQNRDYLDPSQRDGIRVVESFHFNEEVRALRAGARGSGSTLPGDLSYTLDAVPNHHHALDAMMRLALREKTPIPLGMEHIDCRFQWAEEINPRDGAVHMIHAQYRIALGQRDRARELLVKASELEPHNPTVQYNVGLLYFRLNDYSAAREHARHAYAMGFPLLGLRNMLERSGYRLD